MSALPVAGRRRVSYMPSSRLYNNIAPPSGLDKKADYYLMRVCPAPAPTDTLTDSLFYV